MYCHSQSTKDRVAFYSSGCQSPVLRRIALCVLREICEYCNEKLQIVDLREDRLYLLCPERKMWSFYPLNIKVKSRSPLLACGSSVYLFSCGLKSNKYAENCTYLVSFLGQITHLADSILNRLQKSAVLYDNDHDYIYFMSGSPFFSRSLAIQVYKPKSDLWMLITAKLLSAHRHFPLLNPYSGALYWEKL